MSSIKGVDAPAIMRIGAARLTAGLDRMPRLDLEAHRDIFGPLPRLSAEELIAMAEQVDLNFIARRLDQLGNDVANVRDDIVVLTAMVSRAESSVTSLVQEMRATHSQMARASTIDCANSKANGPHDTGSISRPHRTVCDRCASNEDGVPDT